VCQPPHIVTSLYIILFIVSCFLVKKEQFLYFWHCAFFQEEISFLKLFMYYPWDDP
jgi:hypothetical protein